MGNYESWQMLVELLRYLVEALEEQIAQDFQTAKRASSEYRRIVNQKLNELAVDEYGIELKEPVNFVGIAEAAARSSGVPNPSEAALVLLDQVITRTPSTTQIHELNRDYARGTVLANLVHYLREKKRFGLTRILEDSRVSQLMQLYRIKPATVEGYFRGKAPNKEIDITRLWEPKGRVGALASFDSSKGSFEGYLKTVLRNAARDMRRVLDQESDVLGRAVPIKVSPDDTSGVDPERTQELSVDPGVESDVRLTVNRFRQRLRQRNPKYLEMIRAIRDQGLDPSLPRDFPRLQKALGIQDREKFKEFRNEFLSDLRDTLSEYSDGPTSELSTGLLRAAKKNL
jgi:hypothetical protein